MHFSALRLLFTTFSLVPALNLFSSQAQETSSEDLAAQAEALAAQAQLSDATRTPLKPQVTSVAETRYRIGEFLEFDSTTHSITLPAQIILDGRVRTDGTPAQTPAEGEVPIEFYLVEANNGPVHETLLTTQVKAAELQLALLLLSYKADQRVLAKQRVNTQGEPITEVRNLAMDALLPEIAQAGRPESLMEISLSWEDERGVMQFLPLRDGLKKRNDLRPAEALNFVFTGSYQEQNFFAAARTGTLISSFLVHEAIINPADVDALADDQLVPNAEVLPPAGQEVTLNISPLNMAEEELELEDKEAN